MNKTDRYVSPLSERYASDEMQFLFSADKKFSTWRKLWVALARAEKKLGLNITESQISAMEEHIFDIDYEKAARYEKELRHDVMAHVKTYGEIAPEAAAIIHLGATSCYVGDNTDIIIMRDALLLIRKRLIGVMKALAQFADTYKSLPALGFTHFQPAQLVTVGKRASLWLNDLLLDYNEVNHRLESLLPLGCKGTTGTQASFMELFIGDHEKCLELDKLICEEIGFTQSVPVSGQTYSRKTDSFVLAALSGIAQSAMKFANDMRLLSHLKECEEPFEVNQIGSSAMPYKRNPMRSERICALARYIISDEANAAFTAGTQWFERTLDDSANKRISIPEAFLAADAILLIYQNIASGIRVYPKMIEKHINDELPFMATENIMMRAVKNGGNRQELHERIRVHSIEAGRQVKELGQPNDLVSRIAGDPEFHLSISEIEAELKSENFIGRAPRQTEEFLEKYVNPVIGGHIESDFELKV